MHPGAPVGVLQVVDQLGEVLDRVDVVVRRRRDETDARRGVPGLRDPGIDLVPRQLAALTGLRALGHLDLDVLGAHEVLAGHPEPTAGDLLDLGLAGVAVRERLEPLRVLAALAGVRLGTQPVHGDRQRLVGLLRDRAVGHRPRGEPGDDRRDGLDLVDRDRADDPPWKRKSPRRVISRCACSSTRAVYCLKMSYRPARVECCSRNTVSGSKRCCSPSRRHWYSPPTSSLRWAGEIPVVGYAVACRLATSAATASSPMPPSWEAVPVKYLSTSSLLRPIASNTWAPLVGGRPSRCPSWT